MEINEQGSGLTEEGDVNPECDLAFDPEWSDSTHSKIFHMSHKRFALELMFRYAWIWLLSLSLLAVAGLVLGVSVDLRWIVVALMIICIVVPMVLGFLYYYYGLRRECFVNTMPHRLVLKPNGIACRLLINGPDTLYDKVNDYSVKEELRWRDEFFPFNSMERFIVGKDSAIVPLKKPFAGFIWIPADSFTDVTHLSHLLKQLDENVES